MLRHLPFVRPDFAKRALRRVPDPPVDRGGVPVRRPAPAAQARHRPPGHRRRVRHHRHALRFKGITHYDGLYDQSRYFDQALTRYFQRKGWRVHQFSMLRPLSELLIEKILAERYPDLQRHQVSCHATHKDEQSRARAALRPLREVPAHRRHAHGPGRRSRRAAATPRPRSTTCPEEVLLSRDVHQESAGAEQLALLLHERGLWNRTEAAARGRTPRSCSCASTRNTRPWTPSPRTCAAPCCASAWSTPTARSCATAGVWLPFDPFAGARVQPLPAVNQHPRPPAPTPSIAIDAASSPACWPN